MKRISGVLVLLLFSLPLLFPTPFEVEMGLGVHDSSLYDMKPESSMKLRYGNLTAGVNLGGSDYINTSMRYDASGFRFIRTGFGAYWSHTPETGGFAVLTGDFGLELMLLNPFYVRMGLGLQAGLSYSQYTTYIPTSLSPYIIFAIGAQGRFFKLEFFGNGGTFFEKTFQAVPMFGLDIQIGITENHWIIVETYTKLADYMEGPPLQMTDLSAKISYCYRGGV